MGISLLNLRVAPAERRTDHRVGDPPEEEAGVQRMAEPVQRRGDARFSADFPEARFPSLVVERATLPREDEFLAISAEWLEELPDDRGIRADPSLTPLRRLLLGRVLIEGSLDLD
jgi:hypothetical protein